MSRLHRSVAAMVFAVALGLGATAGPASGDEQVSPAPSPTIEVTPTPTTTTTTPSAPETTTTSAPSTPDTTTSPSKPAAPVDEVVDLRLAVWLDKPAYLAHEQITAHARVTNVGTAVVPEAVVTSTGNLSYQNWSPQGTQIGPGESRELSAAGWVTTTSGPLTLVVTVEPRGSGQDANPADNTVTVSVPVTYLRGSFRGTVYSDDNGNGVLDPGEGLGGIEVTAYGNPGTHFTTRTDADGRYAFPDLPAGTYSTEFSDDQWRIEQVLVETDDVRHPDVLARAVRRIGDNLVASMAFERQSYRVGDTAKITVTLTNKDTRPLSDIVCRWSANGQSEVDAGALTVDGPGARVPAGSTRTFGMTASITSGVATAGHLRVHCMIGAPPITNGFVTAETTTRVPGGRAAKVGGVLLVYLGRPRYGPPLGRSLPGVKVWLRDQVTGKVLAEDITAPGTAGFTFLDVPAGVHDFRVVGPWRPAGSNDGEFSYGTELVARDGENGLPLHTVYVVPGPDQPDPDQIIATPTPPQAAPPTELAATGADVAWLALGGLLTLTAGAGVLLGTIRRRR